MAGLPPLDPPLTVYTYSMALATVNINKIIKVTSVSSYVYTFMYARCMFLQRMMTNTRSNFRWLSILLQFTIFIHIDDLCVDFFHDIFELRIASV